MEVEERGGGGDQEVFIYHNCSWEVVVGGKEGLDGAMGMQYNTLQRGCEG